MNMAGESKVNRTCKECGAEFRAWPNQVRRGWAQFCSCQCKHDAQRTGGYLGPGGYLRVRHKGHPLASAGGYIFEHWIVMYEANPEFAMWARVNGFTIHHKNGVRDDNALENLEYRAPGRHPQGWSFDDMKDALERYGYRVLKREAE